MTSNPRLVDLTGKRFGSLVVQKKAGNHKNGAAMWNCSCDCGKTTRSKGTDLRLGKVLSCGHGRDDAFRNSTKKHGKTKSRLYETWKNMRRRCASDGHARYGARGISVCSEWNDFAQFQAWAMSSGYSDDLTIERIDVSLGYTSENCCWIPQQDQAKNRDIVAKRSDGTPWLHVARSNGVTDSAYRTRVFSGWGFEEAATWPMRKRRPSKTPSS